MRDAGATFAPRLDRTAHSLSHTRADDKDNATRLSAGDDSPAE